MTTLQPPTREPSRIGSIKTGDWVQSGAGWIGKVVRVVETRSIPYALVRWEKTGSLGRHTVTTLQKVEVG